MKFKKSVHLFKERCGFVPQRYILTIMAFLGLIIIYIVRTCLSMAITKMSPGVCQAIQDDGSMNVSYTDSCRADMAKWSEDTKGQILGSFYYGYLVAHIPGAYLVKRFGGKYTFGLGVLLSSILSMLSPLAACHSSGTLIAVRIIMGLTEGPTFPALSDLLAHWAPPGERTLLASSIFAGVQIGTVVSMSVTGYMLQVMEWKHVFYILGAVGVAWFLLWTILCFSKPSLHPFISSKELNYLKEAIPETHNNMPTPWKAILKSKAIWSLSIAEIGHDYGLFTMTSDLPKYYCDLTNMSYGQNGQLSGLPFLVMWLASVFLGFLSDRILALKLVTTTQLRRILATLGAVVPGVGMVCASYLTDKVSLVALVTVSMAFMGCCYSSLRVNPLDLSPNHSATIMAIVNGAGSIPGTIAPSIVGVFLKQSGEINFNDNRATRRKAWENIFWVVFAVLVITNFPFMIFGSGEVQPWDKPDKEMSRSELRRRSTISGGEPIREKYKNFYPEQPVIIE